MRWLCLLFAFCLSLTAQVSLPPYQGIQAQPVVVGVGGGFTVLDHQFRGSTGGGAAAETSGMTCPSASLMVVLISSAGMTGGTITDSTGANTYTTSAGSATSALGSSGGIEAFWKISPTVASGMTVTGGNYYSGVQAVCVSGTTTFGEHQGSSPLTTGADNMVVFAAWPVNDTSGTYSVDSGFSIIEAHVTMGGQYVGLVVAYKVVAASGTVVDPVLTHSVNGVQSTRIIWSFRTT